MKAITNLLTKIFSKRTQDFVFTWLEPDQVPDGLGRHPIRPNEQYVRVELRALRVVHVRQGLTKFYGMVNSHITLPHLAQGDAEFQTVVAPPELKHVEAADLSQYMVFNKPLAGPVPYRGGVLRFQVGLFSVAYDNLLDPYVNLLEEISKKCSVEFVNLALPYAGLLSTGIGLLTGAEDQTLEIGVSTSIENATTGWALVMRASHNNFPADRLRNLNVTKDDFKLTENGKLLTDFPYFLLRFSASDKRHDWFKIPELMEQHESFRNVLRKRDANQVSPALEVLKAYLFTCADLLEVDAESVYNEALADVKRLYPATPTAAEAEAAQSREPRSLEAYQIY